MTLANKNIGGSKMMKKYMRIVSFATIVAMLTACGGSVKLADGSVPREPAQSIRILMAQMQEMAMAWLRLP